MDDDISDSPESNLYLNSTITEDEILKCIKNLNNGKAASPVDNIIDKLKYQKLKSYFHRFLQNYSTLFWTPDIFQVHGWKVSLFQYLKIKASPQILIIIGPSQS